MINLIFDLVKPLDLCKKTSENIYLCSVLANFEPEELNFRHKIHIFYGKINRVFYVGIEKHFHSPSVSTIDRSAVLSLRHASHQTTPIGSHSLHHFLYFRPASLIPSAGSCPAVRCPAVRLFGCPLVRLSAVRQSLTMMWQRNSINKLTN